MARKKPPTQLHFRDSQLPATEVSRGGWELLLPPDSIVAQNGVSVGDTDGRVEVGAHGAGVLWGTLGCGQWGTH